MISYHFKVSIQNTDQNVMSFNVRSITLLQYLQITNNNYRNNKHNWLQISY